MRQWVGLCERGFDLTVWFVAAWRVSLEAKLIEEALTCQRTGGCVVLVACLLACLLTPPPPPSPSVCVIPTD